MSQGPKFGPYEAKMASSHDETSCPRDLLQGQVAGTIPIVCAYLYGCTKSGGDTHHFVFYLSLPARLRFSSLEVFALRSKGKVKGTARIL